MDSQPSYPDPPEQGQGPYGTPGYQGIPQAPPVPPGGYPAQPPAAVPQGMHYDPNTELTLPDGVELASVGRRIGAYFLSLVLIVVTLVIGYVIWGLIAWSKGRSPALQVLGMRCWKPADNRVAGWGTMALRDVVGGIAQGILGFITGLVSFILFVSGRQHKSIPDWVGSTVVVHDPGKALDSWQRDW
ncbi:RDD family protein [Catenulispora sp. NF23]|uniref:RDD family protein n=1 Tax=Catenulispora pinistramenti TaxID=2705254 RepID=A0ABS5KPS4_9ACTN|nr:RDD family protein [Catenulispora pinistramenti]MBS2535981.1 RDD family protein [Catenulispora pinistramenti]MBS2547989.1 RDD family protein [Catenulispora pinistramenti]